MSSSFPTILIASVLFLFILIPYLLQAILIPCDICITCSLLLSKGTVSSANLLHTIFLPSNHTPKNFLPPKNPLLICFKRILKRASGYYSLQLFASQCNTVVTIRTFSLGDVSLRNKYYIFISCAVKPRLPLRILLPPR